MQLKPQDFLVALKLIAGRRHEVHPVLLVFAAMFLARYAFLV